ncbi:MAG: M48 family metalloprotease [Halobacteriota archaeon]|nr:M48 family metalloprotease [Halobacteriota archaeon]
MSGLARFLITWTLITILMIVAGWFVGDMIGIRIYIPIVALVLMASLFIPIYLLSDMILLRRYHPQEVQHDEFNILKIVGELSEKLDIPTPRIFVTVSPMPNIFTVVRNPEHTSIVLTGSLLRLLDEEELMAVMAHEICHIKDGKTKTSSIVAMISGTLIALATTAMWASIFMGFGQEDDPAPNIIRFFVTSLVAPPAALLIQLTSSKSREYIADEKSAYLHGKPQKLKSALEKIEEDLATHTYEVNPAHVHLFILDPLRKNRFHLMGFDLPTYNLLFRTHPPVGVRLRRLNEMEKDL